ncbi:hypothetical protein [Planktotalea arctica]|uniref:hypothetical protein n=1 Tax=Planktotalea arctica TaxID=1481893 RepID=UPI000A17031C|nr:hypothetical protein [Planktotalea arctica]
MLKASFINRSALLGTACLLIIVLFLSLWARLSLGQISALAIVSLLAIVLSFFAAGLVFTRFVSEPCTTPLSIVLVSGGLLTGIALYILRALTPLGMTSSYLVFVALIGICALYQLRQKNLRQKIMWLKFMPECSVPEVCAILIACLATTFWCQDLFMPFSHGPTGEITLTIWADVFYHLSQISNFSIHDKDFPLSDVQFVRSSPGLYHYGSYTVAALFSASTQSLPIVSYSAIYVPLALVFVYLAGFGIIRDFFGVWPAFISMTFLATFPDPSFYGLRNPFFGYNWLQQIAPSGAYGVACACIALYFILKACAENRAGPLWAGLVFVILTGLFKAQIFVPLVITAVFFPVLFYGAFNAKTRLIGLISIIFAIFLGTKISQSTALLPSLTLDGSALEWYRTVLLSFTPEGGLKSVFSALMGDASASYVRQYTTFAVFLFFSTLGVFGIALLASLFIEQARMHSAVKFAPFLVVAVYLVLASTLALEQRKMGTPEEFLHRHFVWAYFVVSLFSLAAISQAVLKMPTPKMAAAGAPVIKALAVGLGVLSVYWPASVSSGIQSAPYLSAPYPRISSCEMEAVEFINARSARTDILHATDYNKGFRWSGLTGLRAYVTDSGGYRIPEGAQGALDNLVGLEVGSQAFMSYLRSQGVDWLVSRQSLEEQMFHCGAVFVSRL